MGKLIIFIGFLLIVTLGFAEEKNTDQKIIPPSYQNFIGKNFKEYEEIDPDLHFMIGTGNGFYKYAVNVCGNYRYLIKAAFPKIPTRFQYIFFTKLVGDQGYYEINKILDVVTIDMNDFPDNARIWVDYCECTGKKSCDDDDVVAIYHYNQEMTSKGMTVRPLKAWKTNIVTEKLEEISPDNLRCSSNSAIDK